MFHPTGQPMERGWVGRVDGDRVVHLAAQTLQSFFTGGASAREHAEYPRDGVVLLAPVLHPPAVRVFEPDGSFGFANPAAVVGPGSEIAVAADEVEAVPRLVAVIGLEGAIGGYTGLLELRAPELPTPKDRDFGLATGPVVVTPDEIGENPGGTGFDWVAARDLAAAGTVLRAGDLLAGPPLPGGSVAGREGSFAFEFASVGELACVVR
jgi:hypothetical protein